MLILGIEPCHVICFIVYCYLFILGFFYLHGFSGVFFCKINCSWHFFTSSGPVPLGVGCIAPPFRGRVTKGSKLCIDDLGKRVVRLTRFNEHGLLKRRLTTELGGRCLDGDGVRLIPTPGWSWLGDVGDGVNCFYFLSLKIHGDCWQGAGMTKSSLLNYY